MFVFMWIPAHAGILGNEVADSCTMSGPTFGGWTRFPGIRTGCGICQKNLGGSSRVKM